MSSKKDQFLTACRNQKLDTVRWGINAGGQQPSSRDENGMTALMICASLNKHKALQMLCDWTRRARMREQLDLTDGNGDGMTALMMAAKFGHDDLPDGKVGIVSLVVERGAPPPPPKEKLVSVNGKFVKVADPPPPGPNGTAFAVTVARGAGNVLDKTNVIVGEVTQGLDVLNAVAALPTVKDNSASPFFAVAKQIGDKRATVAEQAFGKPFAKVTVAKCGVVAKRNAPDANAAEARSEETNSEETSTLP